MRSVMYSVCFSRIVLHCIVVYFGFCLKDVYLSFRIFISISGNFKGYFQQTEFWLTYLFILFANEFWWHILTTALLLGSMGSGIYERKLESCWNGWHSVIIPSQLYLGLIMIQKNISRKSSTFSQSIKKIYYKTQMNNPQESNYIYISDQIFFEKCSDPSILFSRGTQVR